MKANRSEMNSQQEEGHLGINDKDQGKNISGNLSYKQFQLWLELWRRLLHSGKNTEALAIEGADQESDAIN